MTRRFFSVFWIIFLGLTLLSFREDSLADSSPSHFESENVTAELLVDDREIDKTGKLGLALHLKIREGWYILATKGGEENKSLVFDWDIPAVLNLEGDEKSIGFATEISALKQEAFFERTLTKKSKDSKQKYKLSVKLNLTVCKDTTCLAEQGILSTDLQFDRQNTKPEVANIFDNFRRLQFEAKQKEVQALQATQNAGNFSAKDLAIIYCCALMAGFLLNFVPSVLPVIMLTLINIGHAWTIKQLRLHALSFVAGITSSFIVLAVLVQGARYFGSNVRWGTHFESIVFIMTMIVVMFLGTLYLLGLFSRRKRIRSEDTCEIVNLLSYSGTFTLGVVSTMLSIPLAMSLMATAFDITREMSHSQAVFVFVAHGLGMSLPFLLVFIFPQSSLKLLPEPGPWIVGFRQFLAFPCLLTVVLLVWYLGRLKGADAMGSVLVGLVFLGLAAWVFGRWHIPGASKNQLRWSWAFALGCTITASTIVVPHSSVRTFFKEIEFPKFRLLEAFPLQGLSVFKDRYDFMPQNFTLQQMGSVQEEKADLK